MRVGHRRPVHRQKTKYIYSLSARMISSLSDRIASRLLKIITAITVKPVICYRMTRDRSRSMLNCHTSVDPHCGNTRMSPSRRATAALIGRVTTVNKSVVEVCPAAVNLIVRRRVIVIINFVPRRSTMCNSYFIT